MECESTGGGVVYLQSGTYQADDGNEITIPSNVILKGDGRAKTVVHFGYRFTPIKPWPATTAGGWRSTSAI